MENADFALDDQRHKSKRPEALGREFLAMLQEAADKLKGASETPEEKKPAPSRIVRTLATKPPMQERTISSIVEADPLLNTIMRKTGAHGSWNETTAYASGPTAVKAIGKDIAETDSELKICMYSWANDRSGEVIASQIKDLQLEKGSEVHVLALIDRLGSFFVGTLPQALLSRGRVLLKLLPKALWNSIKLGIWPWTFVKLYSIIKNTQNYERLTPSEKRKVSILVGRLISDETLFSENGVLKALKDSGTIIKLTNSELNTQEHSKVLYMKSKDKRVVYSGGPNIGDDYHGRKDGSPHWLDYMVRAEGPIADHVDRQLFGVGDDYDSLPVEGETPRSQRDIPMWSLRNFPGRRPKGRESAEHKQITHTMLKLIKGATTSIKIEHAYLMNMKIVDALLEAATKRGVQVTIIRSQPEQSNIEAANEEHYSKLRALYLEWKELRRKKKLDSGPDNLVSLTSPHVLHSKLMIVDDRYVLVGSANMTTDSLKNHGEHAFLMLLEQGQPENSAPQILRCALNTSIAEAENYEEERKQKLQLN